ncbi:MAG: YcfL family protein [Sedimentisphaerales bacterium]
MKTITHILFFAVALVFIGCNEPPGEKFHLRESVGNDDLVDNVVTRPVGYAFSALIGEGIQVDQAVLRRTKGGVLELNVNGRNNSQFTKRFRYRVEWLDADGQLIQSKTSVWLPMSAMGKSTFSFKVIAPRAEAVDFRMDTRKWE